MNKNQKYFLRILKDHINNNKTEPAENIDWSELLEHSLNHQVAGIVYYQCKEFIPLELKPKFEATFAKSLSVYANRKRLFKEIANGFSEAGIPFYSVKGLNVADYYPVPALRTMGDCDIIVRPQDKQRAGEVLETLGFNYDDGRQAEWVYYKNGLEFELHDYLFYEIDDAEKNVFDFGQKSWDYTTLSKGSEHTLDWNYHYIFLLLHLKKHIESKGVGFRQFMDLIVVANKVKLDWEYIYKTMEELNLTKFLNVCLELNNRWFETEEKQDIDEKSFEVLTESIFKNGVFGFNNEDNEKMTGVNIANKNGKVNIIAKIKILLYYFFPPLNNLRSRQYPFLYKRPYLLPYAWILRFINAIKKNRATERVKNAVASTSVSQDELDKRQNYLNGWGLK